ncbi:hypothetical protein DQQ10_07865 [Pseudochryseolinea flava]|uniref:Uncharacterized protein n=1 Tax=Pseudochryseolinea flava TaxID=2059302 RepID=A0A364Y476_9BACT|nr:hypothetical protein DQQ10_07865 [Pseudochryseolinea flava]
MASKIKVTRLIGKLKNVVTYLDQNRTLYVHQHIDQFFYMQRIQEIVTLVEQFDVVETRMNDIQRKLDTMCVHTITRLREDISWIRKHKESIEP